MPALKAREVARFARQPEWYRESRLFVPGRQAFFIYTPSVTACGGDTSLDEGGQG